MLTAIPPALYRLVVDVTARALSATVTCAGHAATITAAAAEKYAATARWIACATRLVP